MIHQLGNDFPKMIRFVMLLTATSLLGCADGPLYRIKQINPYYRNQWNKDRELGPIFEDRWNEVRHVRSSFAKMDASEKQKFRGHLYQLIANDPSPEIRRESILALAESDSSDDFIAITKASQDKSSKVRMATCEALGARRSSESLSILGHIAKSDEDLSVRAAAIQAIGKYSGDEPIAILKQTLSDKSPAIQEVTVSALQKSMQDVDYGGDVAQWRSYLASLQSSSSPSSTPTIQR